jgi:murein DD-endopeptidase MepM/ murein hydrolase activator NlpD
MKLGVPIFMALVMLLVSATNAFANWPVASRRSYISQWFSRHHLGIDIAANCGTKILAAKNGRVVFAGWKNNGGGWQVIIRTARIGKDTYTTYDHMRSKPRVSKGKRVRKERTVLGYVGSTGNSTGCHLHFATWRGYPWGSGSYAYNPWRTINHGYWLPKRYR